MDTFRFDEESHTYWLNEQELPSVSKIIRTVGNVSHHHGGEVAEYYMQKGKAIHKATEFLDRDILDWDSVSDELLPYVSAWEKFKTDSGFIPDVIEKPIYNKELCYACTPDRVGWIGGESALVEIKTGSKASWHNVQIAAQSLALAVPVNIKMCVYLGKGKYKVEKIPRYDLGEPLFISMLNVYHWRLKNNYL